MIWDSLQLSSDKGDYFLFVTSTWTNWLHSCRILKTMNLYVDDLFGIELLVYLINVQTMKTCFHGTTIFTKMLQQVTLEIVSIQKRCREQYGLYNNLETPAFKLQIWCSVCLFCNLVFHIITSIDHRHWSILFCKYTYSFHKRRNVWILILCRWSVQKDKSIKIYRIYSTLSIDFFWYSSPLARKIFLKHKLNEEQWALKGQPKNYC